eukprot:749597-Hanusia_phi.AAC.5
MAPNRAMAMATATAMAMAMGLLLSLMGWRGTGEGRVELETAGQQLAVENSFFDSIFARDEAKHASAPGDQRGHARARSQPRHHLAGGVGAQKHGISAKQERKLDNAFYDSIEINAPKMVLPERKHHAKVMQAKHAAHREQAVKSRAHVVKESSPSFSEDFAQAKEALTREKEKMRHLEDRDHVKADLQKTNLERLTAHEQARQYEKHLQAVNAEVFPSSLDDLESREDATKSVSHALVDDLQPQPRSKEVKTKPTRSR